MVRRPRRGHIKVADVLEKLRIGRAGAVQVCREAKINSDEYRAATAATQSINDLAEQLTGDADYFHPKTTPIFKLPRE